MVDFCYQKEINYSLCQPCQNTKWPNEAIYIFSGPDKIKTSLTWSIENQSMLSWYGSVGGMLCIDSFFMCK